MLNIALGVIGGFGLGIASLFLFFGGDVGAEWLLFFLWALAVAVALGAWSFGLANRSRTWLGWAIVGVVLGFAGAWYWFWVLVWEQGD